MRRYIILLLCSLSWSWALGQNAQIDSLRRVLASSNQDTSRVLLLAELAYAYVICSTDTSMRFSQQALVLSQKISFEKGQAQALSAVGYSLFMQGDFPQALGYELKALKIARNLRLQTEEALILSTIGSIYSQLGEGQRALVYFPQAKRIYTVVHDTLGVIRQWNNMAVAYFGLKKLDSARYATQQAYKLIKAKIYQSDKPLQMTQTILEAGALRNYGRLQSLTGDIRSAFNYYHEALRVTYQNNNLRTRAQIQLLMAQLFDELHQPDSSIHYAYDALIGGQQAIKSVTPSAASLLARQYKARGQLDSVVHYLEIAQMMNETIFGPKKFQELQLLTLADQQRQQALVASQKDYESQVRFYSVLGILSIVLLIAFILYRNSQQKRKANQLLYQKNEEIQRTLSDLRTTQTQLIQREKMASLGELTAGIAHEIQNPLNFVNNFSEVSVELIEEQKEALVNGNTREALILADDLSQNLQRITQNGQRASNIVRGMLEHSRTSTGERLPTDLNALCEECLRLAYQGMRAKDISFNATLQTQFDPDLPPVSVVSQDISQVLLNLYNNAFYAVANKQKTAPPDYQPTVTISTQLIPHSSPERAKSITQSNGLGVQGIQISVQDNGIGIPDSIKEKIFQPFFTTKPTGEGTGLGLSLSYDIVTKGHGGELSVENGLDEGTEFIIKLPKGKQS